MRSSSMIKKIAIVLAILLAIVLLLFCTSFAWGRVLLFLDLYPKPLAEQYPNSIWTSSDPQIYMTVSDSPNDISQSRLVVNGEEIKAEIFVTELHDHVDITLLPSDESLGRVVLEGNKVRVSDSEISWNVTWDKLFDGAYSTITLERQE